MVTIVVKSVTYRSVEIFFNEFIDVGKSRLGIYRPPRRSEVKLLEEFPDEAILRLFPARVDPFGQSPSGTLTPLSTTPLRRLSPSPFPF